MKLTGGKRLLTEDFKKEEQSIASKMAYVLNPFMEQMYIAMSKNLTVTENLNMEYKTLTVEVDGSGEVTNTASFQTALPVVNGIQVIYLQANDGSFPSSSPFCTWSRDGQVIKIQHVTGLSTSIKYTMKIIVFGI